MNECYLVIDYNNTRFADVDRIKADLAKRYGLSTVLIRSNPGIIDTKIADDVIDLDPLAPNFCSRAIDELKRRGWRVRGGIPFSDKATLYGTQLLEQLGVKADSSALSLGALSKLEYRRSEKNALVQNFDPHFFSPETQEVHSLEQVRAFLEAHPAGIVLKPACEGNNRGVTILKHQADIALAWVDCAPYTNCGLMVEELIAFAPEFSFDGVAHLDFVTKKVSASGSYPVERGQIVGGQLEDNEVRLIKKAGLLSRTLVGSTIGAFHNEIKLAPDCSRVAVVEPNRRPAGMQIWNLAEKAYGTDFFRCLIDSTLGFDLPAALPAANGTAAIRMLGVPSSGVLTQFELSDAYELFKKCRFALGSSNTQFFDFRPLKSNGHFVSKTPKTNADFVAYVMAFSENGETPLNYELDRFEEIWRSMVSVQTLSCPVLKLVEAS